MLMNYSTESSSSMNWNLVYTTKKPRSINFCRGRKKASFVVEVVQEDYYVNTERNKRGKIDTSNQDEDHLEEQDNNKTQEHLAAEM